MAPKGTKRASMGSSEDPAAKRVATFLKQNGVAKNMLKSVEEIVQHPLAGLTEDCRGMLLAMLPWSLGAPSDLRGGTQTDAVKMVEEVAESIQAKLQTSVEDESKALGEQDAQKTELQKGIADAAAALAEAAAAVAARKSELAEASSALLKHKHALADTVGKEKKESVTLEKSKAQKFELEKVKTDNFQNLKDGSWQPGQEEVLFKPVKALMSKISLDESLVTSLPVSLMKKERGPFDQVVVDKFEEALGDKIGELATAIGTMEAAAAVSAAAVGDAKQALESAQAAQQEVASKFGAAQEANAKASAKVQDAKKASAAFEPEYAKATAARQEKADQLEDFRTCNMSALKTLTERISKQKQKADAAAAAAAAAAATAATATAAAAAAAEADGRQAAEEAAGTQA